MHDDDDLGRPITFQAIVSRRNVFPNKNRIVAAEERQTQILSSTAAPRQISLTKSAEDS